VSASGVVRAHGRDVCRFSSICCRRGGLATASARAERSTARLGNRAALRTTDESIGGMTRHRHARRPSSLAASGAAIPTPAPTMHPGTPSLSALVDARRMQRRQLERGRYRRS
jgi:hypothetical protein